MRFHTTADLVDRHWTIALFTALIVLPLFSMPDSASAQGRVYWAEPDDYSIRAAGIDGMSPATVAQGFYMLELTEIDADEASGWLYWTDRQLGTIARSRSDGRTPEFVIGDQPFDDGPIGGNLHAPFGISVDAVNGFLYWSEKNFIRRSRLGGSDIVDLVTGFIWPQALEVFAEENLMFWTVNEGGTYRAHLDGSGVAKISDYGGYFLSLSTSTQTLFVTSGKQVIRFGLGGENPETVVESDDNIRGVGVEEGANRLCWSTDGSITCSTLDGSSPTVVTAIPGSAQSISIDPTSRLISFATNGYPGRIMRCRHDGSGVEDIVYPMLTPSDVSVDPVEGKVYWIDGSRMPVVVSRSNLDGSEIEDIAITAHTQLSWGSVSSVAVDPVSRRLYVGFAGAGLGYIGGIASGPLDGPVDVVVRGIDGLGGDSWDNIVDIVVDPIENVLYYASEARKRIARMSTDGTSHEIVVSDIDPRGIALWDSGTAGHKMADRRLYWVERGQNCHPRYCATYEALIRSANLDGTDAVDVLTGLSDPAYLKIDSHSGKMMWSDFAGGQVMTANLDGTDVRTIASSSSRISGIDFVSSPSAVSLMYPPPLAAGLPTSFNLTWINPTANARSEIQVASGGSLSDIVFALNTPETSAWFDAPIASHDYYWRARVIAAGGTGPWTPWSKFTVGSEGALAVTLSEPSDGAIGVPVDPVLTWQAASSAAYYHLQVSDTNAFVGPIVDTDSLSVTSMAVGPLENETTYYWRVAGMGEDGAFTFSQAFSFTTVVAAPAAVALVSPGSGESGVSTLPEFSWNTVDGALLYTLEVASDSAFSGIDITVDLVTERYASDVALTYDTRYFWHVRAFNDGGAGPWSETRAFRTSIGTAAETDVEPTVFSLYPSYPNPFRATTTIRYGIPTAGRVKLSVTNLLGRTVATLVDEVKSAGRHEVIYDARDRPSGLYLFRLTSGNLVQTRTMTVLH